MGEWKRTTREIAARELPVEAMTALGAHAERFGIKVPLDDCVMCIETRSEKVKRGLLRRGPSSTLHHALITPEWLVIVVSVDDGVSTALTVRLREATAEDFLESPMYQVMPDNGVHVNGLFTGQVGMQGNAATTMFVPLGEEPVSERFKKVLDASISEAKK